MPCQRCSSERVLFVQSHADDRQFWILNGNSGEGYLPYDFGIGGGDDVTMNLCLDCGQVQGKFPLPKTEMEQDE